MKATDFYGTTININLTCFTTGWDKDNFYRIIRREIYDNLIDGDFMLNDTNNSNEYFKIFK